MAAQDYLNKYNELFKQSQAYDVNAFTNEIEKQYNERQNYNKDLIEQQNRLQQESLALPAQLRQEYANSPIRNALAQEAIIASRRAGVGQQLGSTTDLLNARGQQFQDILGRAVGGYQTQAQKAQTAAENMWRLYQDAQAQEAARRSSGGSGGGGLDLNALMKSLVGDAPAQPSEAQRRKAIMDKAYEFARSKGVGVSSDSSGNIKVGNLLINPLTGAIINKPAQTQKPSSVQGGSAFLNFIRRALG